MKKFLLIIGVAFLFMSCEKPIVEIVYNVNAEFNVWDVVSGFKDLEGGFLYKDGEPVYTDTEPALDLYIYDEKGDLLSTITIGFTNFKEVPKLSFPLKEGKYTFVTVVYDKAPSDKYVWTLAGTNKLQNFTISETESFHPGAGHFLGVSSKQVNISKAETFKISVPPTTSIINFNFRNLPSAGITKIVFSYKTKPDYFDVAKNTGYNIEIISWRSIEKTKTQYTNLVFSLCLFPTSELLARCDCFDANGNIVLSGYLPSYDILLNKTCNYTIDCLTGKVAIDTKAGVTYDDNVMTLSNPAK